MLESFETLKFSKRQDSSESVEDLLRKIYDMIEEFLLNFLYFLNDTYKNNINHYRIFLSLETIVDFMKKLINVIISKKKFFPNENNLSKLFENVLLKIEFEKYLFNLSSEMFSSETDYKQSFMKIFNDNASSKPNVKHDLNTSLIKKYNYPIVDIKELFDILFPVEEEINKKKSFVVFNKNYKNDGIEPSVCYFVKLLDFIVNEDFELTFENNQIRLENQVLSDEDKHIIFSNYIEYTIIRPLIYVSNNLVIVENNLRQESKIHFNNILKAASNCLGVYYSKFLVELDELKIVSNKFKAKRPFLNYLKKSISDVTKVVESYNEEELVLNTEVSPLEKDYKQKVEPITEIKKNSTTFKDLIEKIEKINKYKSYEKMEVCVIMFNQLIDICHYDPHDDTSKKLSQNNGYKNFEKDYLEKINQIEPDSLNLIFVIKFSDIKVNHSEQILRYLLEKSFMFSRFYEKEMDSEEDKENVASNLRKKEIQRLNCFHYFGILTSLMMKDSSRTQNNLLSCFNKSFKWKIDENNLLPDKNIKENDYQEKLKLLLNGGQSIPIDRNKEYKDFYYVCYWSYYYYWRMIKEELVSKIFLRNCLIEVENAKKFIGRQQYIQISQIEVINNFLMYSCENFFDSMQDLLFYKNNENKSDDSIIDLYIGLLSVIIELVEFNEFENKRLIKLSDKFSDCLLSAYQGTRCSNILQFNEKSKAKRLSNSLEYLLRLINKNIYVDLKIYKSRLIETYSNIFNLSKIIIIVDKKFNKEIELIFPVKASLDMITNFIFLFTRGFKKDENNDGEKILKEFDNISEVKREIKSMTNNKILELHKTYMSEDDSFVSNNQFIFCCEVYLYLNTLKEKKNENALKYLNLENIERINEIDDKGVVDDEEKIIVSIAKTSNKHELNDFHKTRTKILSSNPKERESSKPKVLESEDEKEIKNIHDRNLIKKSDENNFASLDGNWALIFFSKILKSVEFVVEGLTRDDEHDDLENEDFDDENEFYFYENDSENENGQIDEVDIENTKANNKIDGTLKGKTNIIDTVKVFDLEAENKKPKPVLRKLYFITNPRMNILSEKEIKDWLNTVSRDSPSTKIQELIEFYISVQLRFEFEQKFESTNPIIRWSMRYVNYTYVDLISFIFVLAINLYQVGFVTAETLYPSDLGDEYSISINTMTAVNIGYNFFFLVLYSASKQKFINYYEKLKIDQELKKTKAKENISEMTKFWLSVWNYINDSNKFSMFLHIIIGIISTLDRKTTSVYINLNLVTLAKFTSTGRNILFIFFDKIYDIFQMVLFLFFVTYMLANFGFFFLNDNMNLALSDLNDQRENGCVTLYRCFISFFNIGIRGGGGIGEALESAAYDNNEKNYFQRYFLEFIFFIMINLLLLNMINGIIITPFGEWRENEEERDNDTKNVCFICSLDRSFLQQRLINFTSHNKNDHCVQTYLEYLIYLKYKPSKDLDADESYIKAKIENKSIECFPINRAFDPYFNPIEKQDD